MPFVLLFLFAVVAFFMPEWKKGELTRNKTERFPLDGLVWNSKCRILHYVSVIKAVVVVAVLVVFDLTRHANCSRQSGLSAGFRYGNIPTPSSSLSFVLAVAKFFFFLCFILVNLLKVPGILVCCVPGALPSCLSSLATASFAPSFHALALLPLLSALLPWRKLSIKMKAGRKSYAISSLSSVHLGLFCLL